MATTFKRLFGGSVPTANSTVNLYTVPTNYKTIIKSFIISNGSASGINVIVRVANTEILFNYILKAKDTIVIPVMDQCLIAGNAITIYVSGASNTNVISCYISGIEALTTDPEYSGVARMGLGIIPSSSSTIVSSWSKERIVKGIILCNTNSSDTEVTMEVGGVRILQGFSIKGYDTILIPTTDLLIPASEVITAAGYGINYYITGKELG
ncbi:MAG TPA: hypothetical protein DEF35_09060 [Paenibacillus sp.]|uniref:hypothetical protein n=1 Tax=Paenibacillus TaxID=44249 RepID=UPI000B9FA884|nr:MULTISPECIES: hypothetical protein [Paenibacillus]OZQ70683.1 hypothetical protein CA599_12380 [Paenibacillus taichungensis]HBU81774.1 hypothetical protein [Paenibacillus sp.]